MIPCILIDDEKRNREGLMMMLKRHCPELEVVAEADCVEAAFEQINRHNPKLIFLDISKPGKNGFNLLEMFSEINFDVIFVTAYDEFAISEFEFNAIGYLLKPIDYTKLISTVEKAVKAIATKTHANENIVHFVSSLDDKKELLNKIMLHHNDKVILVALKDINYILAKGEYSQIITTDGEQIFSSKSLRCYDDLLRLQPDFVRISKSALVNLGFIRSYSKGKECSITLKDDTEFQISRRRKTEIIERLKVLAVKN